VNGTHGPRLKVDGMRRLRLALLLLASFFLQPVNAGELEDRFLLAVRAGDVARVKAALGAGVPKFRYDRMALSFAADRGNAEVVKLLLEAGADVSSRDTQTVLSNYRRAELVGSINSQLVTSLKIGLESGAAVTSGDLVS